MRFMWFIHFYNLVALKSFIITSGSFDQRKCLGDGREAYDSPQTFVVLRGYVCICVGIYVSYIYIYITYMYMALYRQLEALRGKTLAVQSAGGILTRLIQSIICRGTSSPSALLPDSVGGFSLRPISRSLFSRSLSLIITHAVRSVFSLTCVNTAIAHGLPINTFTITIGDFS